MKIKIAVHLIVALFWIIYLPACNTFPTPTYQPGEPKLPIQDSGEARIRYIIADIQLSGLDGYYRGFTDDPYALEALIRWDAGIRVQNISDFERKEVNGSIQVVYANTDISINGMDVILTTPLSGNSHTDAVKGACNNSYWPITENAYWEYHVSYLGAGTWDGSEFNEIWTTELINSSNGKTTFTINIDTDLGRGGPVHYYCDSTGIYKEDPSGWLLVLPPEDQIAIGNSFNTSWGEPLTINGRTNQSTNFGDLQMLDTQTGVAVEYSIFRSFARGIGIYSESINTDSSQEQRTLINYGGIGQSQMPSPSSYIQEYTAPTPIPTPLPTQIPLPTIPPFTPTLSSHPPVITSIAIQEDWSQGYLILYQYVYFYDLGGDAYYIDWTLVDASTSGLQTKDGTLSVTPEQQIAGTYFIGVWTCGGGNYSATESLVLTDLAGYQSAPYQISFNCR